MPNLLTHLAIEDLWVLLGTICVCLGRGAFISVVWAMWPNLKDRIQEKSPHKNRSVEKSPQKITPQIFPVEKTPPPVLQPVEKSPYPFWRHVEKYGMTPWCQVDHS